MKTWLKIFLAVLAQGASAQVVICDINCQIAKGVKPPEVEDLGTAMAKAKLRAAQLRQVQLDNEQKQLQIDQQRRQNQNPTSVPAPATVSIVPKIAETGGRDTRSFGLLNGYIWKGFSDGEKLYYVVGLNEGVMAADEAKLGSYFPPVTLGDIVLAPISTGSLRTF